MNARRAGSAATVVVALLASATAALQSWRLDGGPPRPTVIVYLIDALRPDHLGTYGYAQLEDSIPVSDSTTFLGSANLFFIFSLKRVSNLFIHKIIGKIF